MLKIVVFDGGYGGEFFADYLSEELPTVEIIRVIDWRNADLILKGSRSARKIAQEALRPYIGRVDLIIFANHLLTATSLSYFKRKYKMQKFIGLRLKSPDTFVKKETLILTTTAVAKTISYYNFVRRIKQRTMTMILDDWPQKIDDGELTELEIRDTLRRFLVIKKFEPQEIILACSQFNDIKSDIKNVLGGNIRVYDSFADAVREASKLLKIRGRIGKKIKK